LHHFPAPKIQAKAGTQKRRAVPRGASVIANEVKPFFFVIPGCALLDAPSWAQTRNSAPCAAPDSGSREDARPE
jgi:hypothetical protein